MNLDPEEKNHEHDEDTEEDLEDLPWVMVNGEGWEDLVHPEEVVFVPIDENGQELPDEAERMIVFREEDYHEPDEDGCLYKGLMPLVVDPEDPGYYTVPDSFGCTLCPGTTFMDKEISNADGFFYYCEQCGAAFMLETRSYLRNAAVLWHFPDPEIEGSADAEK